MAYWNRVSVFVDIHKTICGVIKKRYWRYMQTNSKIKPNKSCSCYQCKRGRGRYDKRYANKKIRRTGLEKLPRVYLGYTD